MPIFDVTDGTPVELGEGRGDLRYSSQPFPLWDGAPWWNGRPVSYANIYATQPWVAIAVNRLLWWAMRVPLKVYRRLDDENRQRLRPGEHPLATAIGTPWERGTMYELITALLGPLLVHGNSLLDVDEGNSRLGFTPLDWRTVSPITVDDEDPNADIVGWKIYDSKGRARERSADTVMHLKWWSPLGQLGISPLRQIRSSLEAEATAVDWTINNLRNGARPSGMVEMDEAVLSLDAEQRRELYERAITDMRDAYGGELNAGQLAVIPPGFKWTTADYTTAVEAEIMAQRLVNRNEVAAVYNIPPPMIGQLERSTFNNITTLRELAYTDGLAPPLVMIEQKINAHIIEGILRQKDVYVEFDLGYILRGDRLKEIQAFREGILSGIYTPNEVRQNLNLPSSPAPDADKLWMPKNNSAPIDDAARVAP